MRCAACEEETEQAPCIACGEEPRLGGRYALIGVIGRGAHGTTWEARAPSGERVALKEMVLARSVARKTSELWEREAAVLRQLEHPAIPGFVEAFTAGTGRTRSFCVVQEYVEGHTLAAELAQHRYTEAEVLAIAEEIQGILAYLHGLSPPVVHRDLKPANVMRRPDGSLALIDFGSVRDTLKDADLGGSTVAGTFGFMAPEQFRGDAVPATDFYGLGALMAALLTRQDPARMLGQDRRLAWEAHCTASPVMRQLVNGLLDPDPRKRGRVELREVGFAEPVDHEVAALFDASEPVLPVRFDGPAHLRPTPSDPLDEPERVTVTFAAVAVLMLLVVGALVTTLAVVVIALSAASPGVRPLPPPLVAAGPNLLPAATPLFVRNTGPSALGIAVGDHTQQVGPDALVPVPAGLPVDVGVTLPSGYVTMHVPQGFTDPLLACSDAGCALEHVDHLARADVRFDTRVMPTYPDFAAPDGAECRVDFWLAPSGQVAHVSASGCPSPFATAAEDAVSDWRHAPVEHPARGYLRVDFQPRSP